MEKYFSLIQLNFGLVLEKTSLSNYTTNINKKREKLETREERRREAVHWLSGTNIVLGVWLFIAPFAVGYTVLEPAVWNDMVIGATIFILALIRTMAPLQYEGISWTNAVLGGWLIIAPFILGYSAFDSAGQDVNTTGAIWNDIVIGVIVLALAAWSAQASKKRTGYP